MTRLGSWGRTYELVRSMLKQGVSGTVSRVEVTGCLSRLTLIGGSDAVAPGEHPGYSLTTPACIHDKPFDQSMFCIGIGSELTV
jgi:hypothetical protein